MKSNLLINRIYSIQIEYKQLLTSLLSKFKSNFPLEALDEICIFWLRHIDTIRLFLKSWIPSENCYVFTAATYMDFHDNEHLPFLIMGEQHILDDPLSKYSEILSTMPKGRDADFLINQIIVTAEDNLKILENVQNEILILPLRLLNQSKDYDFLYEVGEKAFISLFHDINSIDEYFEKCNSIDDIVNFADNDISRLVMFSEEDDETLPFVERFRIALAGTQYLLDERKGDAYNFFILVFGCIQQAIDIIISCIEYGCIPYIRYPVSLHYISLLSGNVDDKECSNLIQFKMNVAFAVYSMCDKSRFSKIGLDDFLKKNREYQFDEKLFQALTKQGITVHNYWEQLTIDIVTKELEKFYDILCV